MKKALLLAALILPACERAPLLNGRSYAAPASVNDRPNEAPVTATRGGDDAVDDTPYPILPRRDRSQIRVVDKRLPSGVHLVVLPDHSFPAVELTVAIGLHRDDPSATTEVLESLLSYWSRHHNGGVDVYDAAVFRTARRPDGFDLTMSTLTSTFGTIASRFLQRLTRTDFERRELSLVRAAFVDRDKRRTAAGLAFEELGKRLYPAPNTYAASWAPFAEIDDVSISDVESLRRTVMVKDNITIAAMGDVEPDALAAIIERELKTLAPSAPHRAKEAAPSRCDGKLTVVERAGASQAWLEIGYPAVSAAHADAPALRYLASAAGSHITARLNRSVRGGLGASYGVHAYASLLQEDGSFRIEASLDPSKAGAALERIDQDVASMRDAPLEADEIASATYSSKIIGSAEVLAIRAQRGEMEKVPTAEEIRAAATRYLVPTKRCAVVVADRRTLSLP